MATENANQSGASTAADSAKQEAAPLSESTGPDVAADEPRAATEDTAEAQTNTEAQPQTETSTDMEATGGQDFSALLENYEKETAATRQEGEIVRGLVVGITDQYVLVDIGYKSEGVVPR